MRSAEGLSAQRESSLLPRLTDIGGFAATRGCTPCAAYAAIPAHPQKRYTRRWRLYHFCGFYYPMDEAEYTILFNLSGDRPELCKERNRLQLRKSGYSLKVDHNMLMLFTWPILEQFTPEKVKDLISYYRVHKKPMIELANGWYHIEILGGETLQDGDYEPTFEFVIQPATNEEVTINADMNFSFEITSSAY